MEIYKVSINKAFSSQPLKFSKEAKDSSLQSGAVPIILIDGNSIVDLMMEKEFGVEKIELPIYSNALDLILQKE